MPLTIADSGTAHTVPVRRDGEFDPQWVHSRGSRSGSCRSWPRRSSQAWHAASGVHRSAVDLGRLDLPDDLPGPDQRDGGHGSGGAHQPRQHRRPGDAAHVMARSWPRWSLTPRGWCGHPRCPWLPVSSSRSTRSAREVLAQGQASRNNSTTQRGYAAFEPGLNVWSFAATSGSGLLTVTATSRRGTDGLLVDRLPRD